MTKFFKDESRLNYSADRNMNVDDLKLGCLMRIADSLETIAKQNPFRDLQLYKEKSERLERENSRMRRSISAYRGVIKRKRKK